MVMMPRDIVPAKLRHLPFNYIKRVFVQAHGNVTDAAKELGVPPDELRKLAEYDIELLAIKAEAREQMHDKCESIIWEALTDTTDKYRQDRAAIFVLESPRAADRGFAKRFSKVDDPSSKFIVGWAVNAPEAMLSETERQNGERELKVSEARKAKKAAPSESETLGVAAIEPPAADVEPIVADVEPVAALLEPIVARPAASLVVPRSVFPNVVADEDAMPRESKRAPQPEAKPEPPPGPKPEIDLAVIYAERFRLMQPNVGAAEARSRAYDYAIRTCEAHYGVGLEAAKTMTRAALHW
jgi:hypothetical protein